MKEELTKGCTVPIDKVYELCPKPTLFLTSVRVIEGILNSFLEKKITQAQGIKLIRKELENCNRQCEKLKCPYLKEKPFQIGIAFSQASKIFFASTPPPPKTLKK